MIIQIIEGIANDMGLSFYHGREDFQNLIADEESLPALYLDQPITTNYNLSESGYTVASYPIKMMLMYKSELDWTPIQHDTNCITPAEAKLREFINRSNNHTSIESITAISSIEFINLLDVNVSGVSLDITLTLRNNYSVCV